MADIRDSEATERLRQPGVGLISAGFAAIFVLCVSAVYFAPGDSEVAAWWPAAGVGTGLLALSSPRRWPALLALTVAVTGAANLVGGREATVSLLFGVVNAAEGLVVVLLLGAHRSRPWLRSRRDFARLIGATGAGALTVGFLAGVVVMMLLDGPLLTTMANVAASHGASQLLVVPVALLLLDPQSRTRVSAPDLVVVTQVISAVVVTVLTFRVGQSLPVSFVPLPFLVWGALVLSLRALAIEALLVGALVTVLTAQGGGPFAGLSTLSDPASAALVQLNLVVIALVSLPLALAMAERSSALVEALAGREESRLAQQDLRREQDFTANLLAATTGTSIIATNVSGTITYVNSGAQNLLGYESADLIGRHLASLHIDQELAERMRELRVRSAFEAIVGDRRGGVAGESYDWTYRRADGGRLRVSLKVSPLNDSSGELLGHLAVAEDITSRQRTQESLRRLLDTERAAVERLSDLDRTKSEFLATVSHELRTPMTSILGFNKVLETESVGPLNERQQDLLKRVDRGGQRLMGLIENILVLSRIETIKDASDHDEVDVAALVEAAIAATEPMRWDRIVDVRSAPMPPGRTVVLGDSEQLERVFVNLLSNAVKFTRDHGSVDVTVAHAADERVAITVTDNGIGIPAEEQQQLFDRFFRASNAVVESIQGTGLGLAIVRSIVEAHDGELSVVSEVGEGTSVTVSLPNGDHPPPVANDATRSTNASASNGFTT